ncbi:MAG: TlpA family protein disulfide reductase [Mucilaginibacter sp.]|nr:TlpA family protein disulfide reductase [Mucilaginibacter sp.]
MGLMLVGFFRPPIPGVKPGEKLPQAPAMVVQNSDGKVIDLQQQKGKVVFINFWAAWCPPCLAELPLINDLYLKVKDNSNIIFLAVDVDNNLSRSSQLLQKNGYRFSAYGGKLNGLPSQFYSGIIPTTLVIDKKGFVVFNHVDRANYADEKFAEYIIGLSKQ